MSTAAVDPIAFVRGTVTPMANLTFPFVTSIVGIMSTSEGEHVGSAVRCMLGGQRVLVTAKHVADQAAEAPLGGGYTIVRGAAPTQLPREPVLVDAARDLAIFSVDSTGTGDIEWWPQDEIDTDPQARAHDYLFLHGFPGARARFLFGDQHNRSLPYGVMERNDDLPLDTRPHEFGMDYDPNNLLLESGTTADFVDPRGLSGAAVWRIGAYKRSASAWRPQDGRLVGIVTRWNVDKRVLLATGAEHLLRLVNGAHG
jgi:hypothetical protein